MSPIYLAADKNKGIFKIDPIDFPNMVLMKPRVFLDAFKNISDGELIFTVIDPILNRKRIRHLLELIEFYGGADSNLSSV